MTDPSRALADLISFHLDAGADAALDEAPHDRFAEATAEPARLIATTPGDAGGGAPAGRNEPPIVFPTDPPPRRTAVPVDAPAPEALPATDTAVMKARDAARTAATLEALRAIVEGFDGCALKITASQLVFADGNPESRLMLVGEAPGAEEDRLGKPFVGRAGQLLDRMLAAIGLDRTRVYIANIVPWRPPGNRTPTPQESAICLPFITRQIELVDPAVLVLLGGFAASSLLGTKDGILKTRGRWFNFSAGHRDIRTLATLHPAYLLRQPSQKRLAWRDMLAIKRALSE